jgi:hypothetical protein
MRYYVIRDFEDDLEERLRDFGSLCLVGLPGSGKTTTARFLGLKNRLEGGLTIFMTPYRFGEEKRVVEFRMDDGSVHEIHEVVVDLTYEIPRAEDFLAVTILIARGEGRKVKVVDRLKGLYEKFRETYHIGTVIDYASKLLTYVPIKGLSFGDLGNEYALFGFLIYMALAGSLTLKEPVYKIFGIKKDSKRELREKLRKIVEDLNLMVVVDDIRDFGEDKRVLSKFLRFLMDLSDYGVRVLMVRRLEGNEYLEVCRRDESGRVGYVRELLGLDLPSDFVRFGKTKQVFTFYPPSMEKFLEILDANGFKGDERIYYASFGCPWLAILMIKTGVEPGEREVEVGRTYLSREVLEGFELNEEIARAVVNAHLHGMREIYTNLRGKSFSYIALLVNDLAEEELKAFCERVNVEGKAGYGKPVWDLSGVVEDLRGFVVLGEERFEEKTRRVYKLGEDFRRLREVLDGLCVFKDVEEDLKTIRDVLTDVFDEGAEKSGECTYRMVLFGLWNVEWLFRRGILKPKSAFIWCSLALKRLPRLGIPFLDVVFRIWEKEKDRIAEDRDCFLHALAFANDLAEYGGSLFEGDDYKNIFERVEHFLDVEGDEEGKRYCCNFRVRYFNEFGNLGRQFRASHVARTP